MGRRTRQFVRRRAQYRCEYCRLSEAQLAGITFHIEHIVAIKHGGPGDASNLALACDRCNPHKGPNIAGIDPATGQVTPLFNPRTDAWDTHFEYFGPQLVGKTAVGRASIQVLALNSPRRLQLREWLDAARRE